MISNQLDAARPAVTPEEAARMTASWPGLLHSPIQTKGQADQIAEAIRKLTVPATKQWIAGRVATVLSQYFASSVPTEMVAAIAEDWHEELRTYPAWAIQNACRWWMGSGNDKRRQKPLPGDIAARARLEMGAINVAERSVKTFERAQDPARAGCTPSTEKPSEAQIARVEDYMAKAGFKPKRFWGAA